RDEPAADVDCRSGAPARAHHRVRNAQPRARGPAGAAPAANLRASRYQPKHSGRIADLRSGGRDIRQRIRPSGARNLRGALLDRGHGAGVRGAAFISAGDAARDQVHGRHPPPFAPATEAQRRSGRTTGGSGIADRFRLIGERDELLLVARYDWKAAGDPVLLRLLDALASRADEVPVDEALAGEGFAAQQHDLAPALAR